MPGQGVGVAGGCVDLGVGLTVGLGAIVIVGFGLGVGGIVGFAVWVVGVAAITIACRVVGDGVDVALGLVLPNALPITEMNITNAMSAAQRPIFARLLLLVYHCRIPGRDPAGETGVKA